MSSREAVNTNFYTLWFDTPEIEPTSTVWVADALSIRPCSVTVMLLAYPSCDSVVLLRNCHQVTKKSFSSQKAESYVGGFAPFLKDSGMGEIESSRTTFDHGYDDLGEKKI